MVGGWGRRARGEREGGREDERESANKVHCKGWGEGGGSDDRWREEIRVKW